MKFFFIENNRSTSLVEKMCQVFSISPSGYYRWRKAPLSNRKVKNEVLKKRIRELFRQHKGMAGSPLITEDLKEEPSFSNVSRNRVALLMKEMGVKSKSIKKYVVTTDSKHNEPVAPNLLDRQFSVSTPNTIYVSDITYLKIGRKWHYLIVFVDLFSRMVVGWDLSSSLERFSAMRALNKAILRRLLNKNGFVQSMSRKGNCWDNAVAESFFGSLKTQLTHHTKFQSVNEAEQALFHYIEIYYNSQRKHSTNGYKSPAQYEMEW